MGKHCWGGWACQGTLRILRPRPYPLRPAALGLALWWAGPRRALEFIRCGHLRRSGRWPPPRLRHAGQGTASVVQALAIGRGQLIGVAV